MPRTVHKALSLEQESAVVKGVGPKAWGVTEGVASVNFAPGSF